MIHVLPQRMRSGRHCNSFSPGSPIDKFGDKTGAVLLFGAFFELFFGIMFFLCFFLHCLPNLCNILQVWKSMKRLGKTQIRFLKPKKKKLGGGGLYCQFFYLGYNFCVCFNSTFSFQSIQVKT